MRFMCIILIPNASHVYEKHITFSDVKLRKIRGENKFSIVLQKTLHYRVHILSLKVMHFLCIVEKPYAMEPFFSALNPRFLHLIFHQN